MKLSVIAWQFVGEWTGGEGSGRTDRRLWVGGGGWTTNERQRLLRQFVEPERAPWLLEKKMISNGRPCIVNDVAMTAIGKRCNAGLMMGTRQPIHRDSAIKLP